MPDIQQSMLDELEIIRKLLVFAVMNMPQVSQDKLSKALGVSQSSISRMTASGKTKSKATSKSKTKSRR